jgi:hypothetical protein
VVNYGDHITPEVEQRMQKLGHRRSFRFNWRSPLVMSSHNPQTLYLGGNHLFKTVDGGYRWQIVSPDLSTDDPIKINRDSGGLTPDRTGAETHCSIVAFSESPRNPALLWAGTDDGNVQITRNGGVDWKNVRANIPGVPDHIWVSHVEASHHAEGTCYVTFDGHRSDHYQAWVFKTTDYGESWINITNYIPSREVMYVIREDPRNENLLFAGSEFSCFVSLDGGRSWDRFMSGMPTVAFHDLVIHPRDGDLVAGTHGRSFWIADDITPLQQFTDEVRSAAAHLFDQRPVTIWEDASRGGVRGTFFFAGENPPSIPYRENVVRSKLVNGGLIHYYLRNEAGSEVILEIAAPGTENRRTLIGAREAGIHRILWHLRFDPTPKQMRQTILRITSAIETLIGLPDLTQQERAELQTARLELRNARHDSQVNRIRENLTAAFEGRIPSRGVLGGPLEGRPAGPGLYLLTLRVGGKSYTGSIRVRPDPMLK